MSACSPTAPNALGANGASGSNTGGIRGTHLNRVRCLSGRVRCLVGSRPVGQGAAFGGIRHRLGGGVGRGAARHAAQQSGRARARLHPVARHAGRCCRSRATTCRIAQQNLRAHAAARGRRRDHRSRRGERRGAIAHHRRGDPAARAAGVGAHQCDQPAAGTAAERVAGRADPGEAGAAGAAAGSGRPAVGAGAAASRHPPGGGATARGDRRYRRGGGEFLSVGEAVGQPRAAVDPAVEDVQPRRTELRRRARRHHPDLRGWSAQGHAGAAQGAAAGSRDRSTRRPCWARGTRWTMR